MNGRLELVEILGMVGACAALLFAGIAVEKLEVDARGASAASVVDIEEPAMPETLLPEEARIAAPAIERPAEIVPPPVDVDVPELPCGRECESPFSES